VSAEKQLVKLEVIMNGLLDGLARCGEHNCPMIRIGDDYCCVIGHTDDCIGMQRVTELVTPDSGTGSARLAFANGYILPLLCPCCGESLLITDAAAFNRIARGLYLCAIGYDPPGEEPEALVIVLAPEDVLNLLPDNPFDPLPEGCQVLALHLDSVKGLYQRSGSESI
jgi:hypothetical protein